MKRSVTIARIIVGGLFIFSGLVKAIDPLGLTYKMQEFFEVWAREGYLPKLMNVLYDQSFLFSVGMIGLEVVLGVALLGGFQKKITLRLLLLLMVFFTFLTSYVLFSGKIATCGCFGDCIPLTPIQTFTKDIILLLLIVFLLRQQSLITPLKPNWLPIVLVIGGAIIVGGVQMHVIKHLPLLDCLPYKKGNDLLLLRQMPADAIPDKFDYKFIYEKNGAKQSFDMAKLPDSSWTYVDREQILVQKGKHNVPLINDFSLTDSIGTDVTESTLSQNDFYYLFFVKNIDKDTANWNSAFAELLKTATQQKRSLNIITAETGKAKHFFNEANHYNVPILSCDATAIKTAARAVPTVFLMKGPIVQAKFSAADIESFIQH